MTDILWLGAHKTGTTFLQKSLDLSGAALAAADTTYLDLETFRTLYTRPLLNRKWPDAPGDPARFPARNIAHRLVFDENIPGLVQHALAPDGLYPDAARRARRIAEWLGLDRPTVVFGVRSFASYLPSLYCETLKSTPFRRFRGFWVTRAEALSWFDLLGRLHAAFPDSPVLVYSVEEMRGHERALLARIAGLSPDLVQLIDRQERLGFSHLAVRALHLMSRQQKVTHRDVARLTTEFPRTASSPAFDPWSEEERAELDARYARDLEQIRTAPFIEVVCPT